VDPFTAIYEQHGEWWIGHVEEIPGANSQGKALEDVRENLQVAARMIIEANRELACRDAGDGMVARDLFAIAIQ